MPKAKVGKVDASWAKGECPDPWQVSFPPPAARLVEEPPFRSSSLAPVIECDWQGIQSSALPEDSVAPASSFEDTGHLRPSQMQVPDFKDLMS